MARKPKQHHNGLPKPPPSDYDRIRRANNPALAKAAAIRNGARWKRTRAALLANHPLCCDPLKHHERTGRIEPATQVHHIRPLVTHPFLAYHATNLAPICTSCHAEIEGRERRGLNTVELFRAGQVYHETPKAAQGGTGERFDGTTQRGGGVKSLRAAAPTPACE